jgi:serine/threonine-protein kinase
LPGSTLRYRLELNPNLDVAHVALGELYRQTGQFAEAARANEEALRINGNNVVAMLNLARVQRLLNDPTSAEETLRKAAGLQPGNLRPYHALGIFLYRQGQYEGAAEQFLRVVSIDDSNFRSYSNLGTAYMLAGRFEEALPVYQRAIALEPDPTTYVNLGLMHYYLGDYENAIVAMRDAVNLSPNDHQPWMNLGDVLYVAGRAGEALDAYNKAYEFVRATLDVNPNEPTELMDLAWIQAMLNESGEALRTIGRAQEMTPDDPYGFYIEALIHNERGDTNAALDALHKAVAKGTSRVLISAEPHLANLTDNTRFREITSGS